VIHVARKTQLRGVEITITEAILTGREQITFCKTMPNPTLIYRSKRGQW
jgi:hypothetical protein